MEFGEQPLPSRLISLPEQWISTEKNYRLILPGILINLAYPTTIQKNNIRIFGKVTITPLKNVKLVGEYTYNHLSNEKTKFEKKFYYAHGGNFMKETFDGKL